jgi:hypothetical protein
MKELHTPLRPLQARGTQPAEAGEHSGRDAADASGARAEPRTVHRVQDDGFVVPISPAELRDLGLSPAQTMAIELMLTGNTMIAAANAAGVTRKTLYNWLHRDAKFQAAYNAWQADAMTSGRSRILGMADYAVDTLEREVRTNPRVALAVVKALGMLDRPTPGSTDPEVIQEQMEIEEQRSSTARGEAMFYASIGSGKVKRDGKPRSADLIAEMEKMRAEEAAEEKAGE